jgi:hypothetical protein
VYCNAPIAQVAPQPYGAPPPYGAPYGAPPPYGAQQYGAPNPYGAPPPNPYGGPAPNPYGAPQQGYYVQQWNQPGFVPQRSWWSNFGGGSAWGTFTLIRLGIAFFVLFIVLVGSCVSALSH